MALLLSFTQNVNARATDWEWAKQMVGTGSSMQSICADATSNIYSTGNFYGTVDFDPGASTFNLMGTGADDAYISKLDNSGNFIWAKAIGSVAEFHGFAIAIDNMGNVYSAGGVQGTVDFDPGSGRGLIT